MNRNIYMQKLFRLGREEHASAVLEMAFTLWVLLAFIFGIIQCGFALYANHFVSYAADQATRFAQVRGSTWSEYTTISCATSAPPSFTMPYNCTASGSDIQNYVQYLASQGGGIFFGTNGSGVTLASTSATTVWPGATPCSGSSGSCPTCTAGTATPGCLVVVQVKYSLNFIPFLKVTGMTFSTTSEKTVLQ